MTQDAVSFPESFVAALLSWILIQHPVDPSFDGSVTTFFPLPLDLFAPLFRAFSAAELPKG
jgi:hypothetical protein